VTAASFNDYAAIAGRVKPTFIHDPRRKTLVASLMDELAGEPDQI